MPAFGTSKHLLPLLTSQPFCVVTETTEPVLGFITPILALPELSPVIDLPARRPREVSPIKRVFPALAAQFE